MEANGHHVWPSVQFDQNFRKSNVQMTLRTFFFLSNKLFFQVKTATEGYVNNTGKNLGTMEGQVEGLTDRMVDVDSNLNYMLGQLSLVVQEFNQVRTIPL